MPSALDASDPDLLLLTYSELRRLAAHLLNRESPGQTLQATALVHEAYLRLRDREWNDRRHFFNSAALVMRRVLIDRGRGRGNGHAGALERVSIPATSEYAAHELEPLDQALEVLRRSDDRWAEVVNLRFFLGLTIEQTAEVLGVAPSTVKEDWAFARAWLRWEVTRRAGGTI